MKIQVLGSGCPTCKKMFELVQTTVRDMGITAEIEYISDIQKIVAMGLLQSPVLVINDKVVLVGATADMEKIKNIILQQSA
ncbi:MAG: thioredoxin family protein [Candidatus Paceibacterota bacterium]